MTRHLSALGAAWIGLVMAGFLFCSGWVNFQPEMGTERVYVGRAAYRVLTSPPNPAFGAVIPDAAVFGLSNTALDAV